MDTIWWCTFRFVILRDSTLSRSAPQTDLGNATTDEVAQAAWMYREQIKELFEQKMFVDTLEYFFTEVDK